MEPLFRYAVGAYLVLAVCFALASAALLAGVFAVVAGAAAVLTRH